MQRHESVITRNNLFVDNQFLPRALSISTHRTPEHQAQMYESVAESGLIDPAVIEKEGNIGREAARKDPDRIRSPDVRFLCRRRPSVRDRQQLCAGQGGRYFAKEDVDCRVFAASYPLRR